MVVRSVTPARARARVCVCVGGCAGASADQLMMGLANFDKSKVKPTELQQFKSMCATTAPVLRETASVAGLRKLV